jgi:orotidine-5'-phosphate decarboxylase
LKPALDLAHATGRGLYVLARTSNPEGGDVQSAVRSDGVSVAQGMVDAAIAANEASGQGAIGLVIGATRTDAGCDVDHFNGSILAPGIGAQGGTIQSLAGIFGPAKDRVLPSASREVLLRGPDPEALREAVSGLQLT